MTERETDAHPPRSNWRRAALRLLAEPLVHFFAIGALLFVIYGRVVGDPRTVVVSAALKNDLARRFQDQNRRAPSPAELDAVLAAWKRDEALYREALREQLEQQDPTVRSVLADKLRARMLLELPKREPTDGELDAWLATHRSLYETPLRYDYEFLSFPKSDASAEAERERTERALGGGARAESLGRPVFGATLSAREIAEKFGELAAARIPTFSIAVWQRLDLERELWLVRLNGVEGGLPSGEALRRRLVADWKFADEQRAVERATQAVVDRYKFEEP